MYQNKPKKHWFFIPSYYTEEGTMKINGKKWNNYLDICILIEEANKSLNKIK